MPHTFLEHSHYPRQRQDHLDVGIGFGGKPAELLHGALLVNLISFLHSDSPFSWKKNFPEAITPRGVRVATFYGLPGNFAVGAIWCVVFRIASIWRCLWCRTPAFRTHS